MGQGMDLTDIDDQDLASTIQVATGIANNYCGVPNDHDFRGGSVTGEEHEWKLGNYMVPGSGKIYPLHKPLTDITLFRLYVTNTQYLDLDVTRIHYHERENALEPLFAEASVGIWAATQVPVAGFQQPQAKIDYTYGFSFSTTRDQMFPDGGKWWRAQNQWWDTTVTPTISVNGVDVANGNLTIDYNEGRVAIEDDALQELDISASEVNSVFASYTYKLPTDIANATAMITTSLLGQRSINEKGLQGLSGIRVEEVELRQSRDAQLARDQVPGLAQQLLDPYRYMHWGA